MTMLGRRAFGALAVASLPFTGSADAAGVGPTGRFEGLTTVSDCAGPLANYTCAIDGNHTLCVEYAALGFVLGAPCLASWTGSVSGVGAVVDGRRICSASGPGSATVTSPTVGQITFNGEFVVKNGAGSFSGIDLDGVAPDGSVINFTFAAGCDRNTANVRTVGAYQVVTVV